MNKDILERRAKRLADKAKKPQGPRTLGFWKHGQRLTSAVVKKADIPKWTRLLIIKNSYKTAKNHSDYIGIFVDVRDADALDMKHPMATLRSQYKDETEK